MAENIQSLFENLQFTDVERVQIVEVRYVAIPLLEQQRLSILRRSPWLFDGEPIIAAPFDSSLSLNEYDFTKILYWVRIHELPMNMMTMDMASTIGSQFGKLVVVDT
ncbi:hypothetical protein V6N12_057266 [Hibiscus sabdariffa]|uniref:DUF4283 domain-containing protein n=1 Tax=Hibiscus sabdariffa TaxID=183260 RepID=A0ABR2DD30_9ROSI